MGGACHKIEKDVDKEGVSLYNKKHVNKLSLYHDKVYDERAVNGSTVHAAHEIRTNNEVKIREMCHDKEKQADPHSRGSQGHI